MSHPAAMAVTHHRGSTPLKILSTMAVSGNMTRARSLHCGPIPRKADKNKHSQQHLMMHFMLHQPVCQTCCSRGIPLRGCGVKKQHTVVSQQNAAMQDNGSSGYSRHSHGLDLCLAIVALGQISFANKCAGDVGAAQHAIRVRTGETPSCVPLLHPAKRHFDPPQPTLTSPSPHLTSPPHILPHLTTPHHNTPHAFPLISLKPTSVHRCPVVPDRASSLSASLMLLPP